jgi:predicted permease
MRTLIRGLYDDVRQATRRIGREPRFATLAIVVLALGIGGNTVVFSVVNALLLRPFPYRDPGRLIEITSRTPPEGTWSPAVRVADFGYWRAHATAYEGLAAYGYAHVTLSGQSLPGFGGAERIVVCSATAGFLSVLQVDPVLGRFFTGAEDRPGGAAVMVLARGAWLRRFGGSPRVLGQTLTLNGTPRTIVGVLPTLRLPGTFSCDAWLPATYDMAANMQPGYDTWFTGDHVIGRLRRDVSRDAAQAELDVLVARLEQQLPREAKGWQVHVGRWGEDLAESEGPRLRLLSVSVATGLLLAVVNLAGLLLARAAAEAKTLAVQASLGATRTRLVRVTLAETVLIAVAGGLLGVLLAHWGVQLMAASTPPHLGLDTALRVDGTVLVFACGLTLLTGVACGLLPALHAGRADVATVLKGVFSASGRTSDRMLSGLVVLQVALALVLLVGGGLMLRSFLALQRVDIGFRPDGVLAFRLSLSGAAYERPASRAAFVEAILHRLRSLPGVDRAGATVPLPMSGEYSGGPFAIEGRPAPASWRDMSAQFCLATPQYVGAIGVRVVRGREFDAVDTAGAPAVLINEALAARFFGGTSPLGQRIVDAGTIVGVVGDIRHNGSASLPEPQIYLPFRSGAPESPWLVVHTTGDPSTLAEPVRQLISTLDRDVPVDHLQTMTRVVQASMADMRAATFVMGGFALFAVALSSLGLYGVLAYAVSRRQQEIGIRLALGATRERVLALVLSRGARLALKGTAIGVLVAMAAATRLESLLFETPPHDLTVFVAIPVTLLAVSLLASLLPALRATRVDPMVLLRRE